MKKTLSKKIIRGNWRGTIVSYKSSIQDAIQVLNAVCLKIVLVIDDSKKLIGTVSDGDIRRGLIKGLKLNSPILNVVHKNSLVATPDMGREMILQLMSINKIQQIPVVNERHHVVGLHLRDEFANPSNRKNPIIVMAGGMGTRLKPYTDHCPKPMLRIAGKPILEHIIDRAKLEGFNQFFFAIRHLGSVIEKYFGTGRKFGVKINYLREKKPLGTAGALSLLYPIPKVPFVITNGDVITDIRYGELIDFHLRHDADATMAVRPHEWQHPFGVVKTRGLEIVGFEEKPVFRSHINAGVYALSPSALKGLKQKEACDMPTLFENLRKKSKKTIHYPVHESWIDIGRFQDYKKAAKNKK